MRTRPPSHSIRGGKRSPAKESSKARGLGYDWQKFRERILAETPYCVRCEKNGVIRLAEEVHHIKPRSTHPHLRLDPDNVEPLCRPCHYHTHREEQHGQTDSD